MLRICGARTCLWQGVNVQAYRISGAGVPGFVGFQDQRKAGSLPSASVELCWAQVKGLSWTAIIFIYILFLRQDLAL